MSDIFYPDPHLLVAGQPVTDARRREPVLNPATEQVLGEVPHATEADLAAALAGLSRAAVAWKATEPSERARALHQAARLLRERSGMIATLITLEMGKPQAEARAEVEMAAGIVSWHAEEARRIYGRVVPGGAAGERRLVLRQPLGPIAAFASWNAPAITPARKLSAALAAGCPIVLKASEETPATALAVAQALIDGGVMPEAISVLFGESAAIARRLIADPAIRGVTFTGSVGVGRQIGAQAATVLKRATLELGGHAPVIVWDDVDADAVAKAAVAAKFRNAGQICTSPTRFYVHERIYTRFRDAFVAEAAQLRLGNGFDPATQMGPLANARRIAAITELSDDARRQGVTIATGGDAPEGPGFFWRPTVLTEAGEACRAADVEPFGPIALLRSIGSAEEALALANRLPLGLASYVMAKDGRLANRLAVGIEAGNVGINAWRASLPETPFGGWKDSGYGVEGGAEALDAFLTVKTVLQA